ncbi:RICIN domain-containing protein [Streptomyces sp. NPDC059340]|uniref:RICIN domain-containing protein n=1 Tax=Streptomyces sp. NPDC059340 TaxID=3346806 RepID=UPI003687FA9D
MTSIAAIGNQIYRIQWHHPDPEKGKGCLGVDESLTAEGSQLLSPGDCTDALGLRYRLEPSGSGYRLRPMDSGMCIGILPPRSDGAQAIQAPCTGADDQSFRFSAA